MDDKTKDDIAEATSLWMEHISLIKSAIGDGMPVSELSAYANNLIDIRASTVQKLKQEKKKITSVSFDELVLEEIQRIQARNLSEEDLVRLAAEKSVIESYALMGRLFAVFREFDTTLALFLYSEMRFEKPTTLNKFLESLASNKNRTAKALLEGSKSRRKDLAKIAVSNRDDQKQKEGWLAHCKNALRNGAEISNLDDLLSVAGYDPSVLKITPRTLKTWAKEAGIVFKPGRPKK